MLKPVFYLLCITVVAAVLWTFGRSSPRIDFSSVEWIVFAVAVALGVARWRFVARRRQKQKIDQMRDSALW
jgi:di/tricarboxylate transporter